MLLSIIIINYNQKEYTLKCIESLKSNLKTEFEIIVVNNSGDDNLCELKDAIIIRNDNKGFGQANNLAAGYAKGKYLLFLNADTILKKDFSSILSDIEKNNIKAAGFGLIYPKGNFQLSFWNNINFFDEIKNKKAEKYFNSDSGHIFDYNSLKERLNISKYIDKYIVDWVSGASLIIEKKLFESLGGFDENYFLFYEDADLCKRISDKGNKIFYMPFDGLVHYKGENSNKKFLSESYYFSKESQLYYYKKYNNVVNKILLRIYLFIKSFFNIVFQNSEMNKKIFKLVCGIK